MDAELLPGAELPLAGVAGEAGQVVDLVVVRGGVIFRALFPVG